MFIKIGNYFQNISIKLCADYSKNKHLTFVLPTQGVNVILLPKPWGQGEDDFSLWTPDEFPIPNNKYWIWTYLLIVGDLSMVCKGTELKEK